MDKESKDLLLKDLCARLPYALQVHIESDYFYEETEPFDTTLTSEVLGHLICLSNTKYSVKPYLRSMSSITSMTKEEREQYDEYLFHGAPIGLMSNTESAYELIDWLNSRHFDYRGLIEKGLALEAPEGMYKER